MGLLRTSPDLLGPPRDLPGPPMTFQDFLGRPRTLVSLVRFYSTNQENSRFFEKLQEFQGCQLAVHGPQVVPRSPAVPRLGLPAGSPWSSGGP